MKKIISGALYNTESAKYIGIYNSRKELDDLRRYTEELYLTQSGKYFLFLSGAKNPDYLTNKNEPAIAPLTPEDARKWAEEKLSPSNYRRLFGAPKHPERKKKMHVSLSERTLYLLNQKRDQTGKNLSELIEWAVEAQYEDIADNQKQ